MSLGLLNFKVTTDPVELWSSPDSLTRQQREYYNDNFGPFYRVEQVVIKRNNYKDAIFAFHSNVTKKDYNVSSTLDYEFLMKAYEIQNNITSLKVEDTNGSFGLEDICFSPMNNGHCAIQSAFTWFQEDSSQINRTDNSYLDHILKCSGSIANIDCFGRAGAPALPKVVFGGFTDSDYLSASSLIITILVNNHNDQSQNSRAAAWESKFIELMSQYKPDKDIEMSYFAERSIEDEINRQSESDIFTVAVSYITMFIYVSLALGQYHNRKGFLVDSKISLGLAGVLIVLLSVIASLGILSYLKFKATLIIIEVIPFLVLAVGVDNIFIIVQTYQRMETINNESVEGKIIRCMAHTGPSLLMAFMAEIFCFFIGSTSSMPCVKMFAINAALALIIDFLLQITVFVSLLTLDAHRQVAGRCDIFFWVKPKLSVDIVDDNSKNNATLHQFFSDIYAPMIVKGKVRFAVILVFVTTLFASAAMLHKVDIGLDQKLSMPADSYVLKYFESQANEIRVGPPVYIVVSDGMNYSRIDERDLVVPSTKANEPYTLMDLISDAAKKPVSRISDKSNSWLSSYESWAATQGCCMVYKSNMSQFCPSTVSNRTSDCVNCDLMDATNRIAEDKFNDYIGDFLGDIPTAQCPYGGHASYASQVVLKKNDAGVAASSFMTYHTVLTNSNDFISALEMAQLLSSKIKNVFQIELSDAQKDVSIFPYSIFYVFYEQFLTIRYDTIMSLALSLITIFVISTKLLGFNVVNAFIMLNVIVSILVHIGGIMYIWDISLNAVSLVNLVMFTGISVEFCSHLIHYFTFNTGDCGTIAAAQKSLANIGSSILSGITLTKFTGILVLAFAKSQIFQVFYFRMYFAFVIIGALHGLILLPVLLSIFGKRFKMSS